jgi:hypothetical protein
LTLSNIGFVLALRKEYKESEKQLTKAAEIQRSVNDKWGLGETLKCLGDVSIHLKECSKAIEYYCESYKLNQNAGRKQLVVACIKGISIGAEALGMVEHAAILLEFGKTQSLNKNFEEFKNLTDEELAKQYKLLDNILIAKINDSEKFELLRLKGQSMNWEDVDKYISKNLYIK